MIIVADSGSTKTDWAFVEKEQVRHRQTPGINPVHLPPDEIRTILHDGFPVRAEEVEAVYFYGAGCIPAKCAGMAGVLSSFFGTGNVFVESDLVGAARGLCGDRPGIACILGTGSNSAVYDGKRIAANTPPLGYILGDEGSGADLGKRLIGDLLKGLLPEEIAAAFYAEHPFEYAEIIERVYRRPGANRFLAGFAPFIHRHIDHPALGGLVDEAFSAFVGRNLLRYDGAGELAVSFTGSVAFYFEKPLRKVLAYHGLTSGKIERSPLHGLVGYHQNKAKYD